MFKKQSNICTVSYIINYLYLYNTYFILNLQAVNVLMPISHNNKTKKNTGPKMRKERLND